MLYITRFNFEDLVEDKFSGYVNIEGDIHHFKEGQVHNQNGPAIKRQDGTCEWWLNGVKHTEADYQHKLSSLC